MQVYYFTKEEYGVEIIKSKKMKLSLFNNLNDPFELMEKRAQDAFVQTGISLDWGCICFSKDYKNPLMWGHYSENHSGICLGFYVPDVQLVKAEYMKKRPDASYKPKKLGNFVKSIDWEYEDEYRNVFKLNQAEQKAHDLFFIDFTECGFRLDEVILGYRSRLNPISIERTIRLNYEDNVDIYNTKLSKDYFHIEKDEILNFA